MANRKQEKTPTAIVKPDDKWTCECGKINSLGAYVAAHWDVKLIHTCECKRKHSVHRGIIKLCTR